MCSPRRASTLGLETARRRRPALLELLQKLKRPNVGVNFDPANMILYDKGDPIEALRMLGPWIRQVHIKDARRTKVPGTWGEEVAAGTGEVDWQAFFATLAGAEFTGDSSSNARPATSGWRTSARRANWWKDCA